MLQAMALMNREWMENLRDPKRIVLFVLFLFFGLMSPVTAKLTPDLLRMMMDTPEMAGIQISMPDPDLFSAYDQFQKNVSQLLLFAVILVFMGGISQEKADGTAAMVLTKGVSRPVYLLSRLLASLLLISIAYWTAVICFLFYTNFLFGASIVAGTMIGLVMMWLYLLFAGSVTLLASTLSKSPAMSALIAFGLLFSLMAITGLPVLRDWSPVLLSSLPSRALDGLLGNQEASRPIIVTLVAIPFCWLVASLVFSEQEL